MLQTVLFCTIHVIFANENFRTHIYLLIYYNFKSTLDTNYKQYGSTEIEFWPLEKLVCFYILSQFMYVKLHWKIASILLDLLLKLKMFMFNLKISMNTKQYCVLCTFLLVFTYVCSPTKLMFWKIRMSVSPPQCTNCFVILLKYNLN